MNPQKQTDDLDLTPYITRPLVSRAAGWIHETFFAPLDKAVDAFTTWHTKRFLAPHLPKR